MMRGFRARRYGILRHGFLRCGMRSPLILLLAFLAIALSCLGFSGCDSILRDHIELYVSIRNGGVIYVDEVGGDDANSGTQEQPKRSIQSAIDLADALMDEGEVWVAEGTYNLTETLVLRIGVSVYGGYSQTDWSRDTELHETVLQGVNLPVVVEAESGSGIQTTIDGFTIITGSGIDTVADDDLVVGISCVDSSPLISNNIIDATDIPEDGIGISNQRSSPTILNNYIFFGSGFNYSWGVFNSHSSPKIWNNVIFAGESPGGSSTGISNQSSSASTIQNNTLHGGECAFAVGIFNLSTGCTIENNIILAEGSSTSWGIYEDSLGRLVKLRHNDFWDCDSTYAYGSLSTPVTYSPANLAGLQSDLTAAGCGAENNVSVDPVFDSGGDGWALSDLSPSEVTEGGDDTLSGVPDTDKGGTVRTAFWSIGAYEKDP